MASRRRVALLAGQVVVSVAVLAALWADAGPDRVRAALSGVDPTWVALAALAQSGGLLLRATRIWSAMGRAAPWRLVVTGALTANLGHLAVPSRVADLAGAAWIARRAGLPVERGVAGYATAAFLEAAAFGTGLMALFAGAAPVIEQVITGAQRREALGWVSLATLGGVAVATVGMKVAGRRPAEGRVGGALGQARSVLANPASLAVNLLLGAAQIGVMLTVFRCALTSVGATVAAPWLCGALVMAVGAVGGMVLPPHFGANTSAAATLVLTPFGATPPEALAFGGVLWFAAAAPDVLLGLVGLWLTGPGSPVLSAKPPEPG